MAIGLPLHLRLLLTLALGSELQLLPEAVGSLRTRYKARPLASLYSLQKDSPYTETQVDDLRG